MCSSPSIRSKTQQWQPSLLLKASAASNNSSPQVIQQQHYYLTTALLFCLTLPYLFVQFGSWQHPLLPTTSPISCRLRKIQRNKPPWTQDARSFLITNTLSYPTKLTQLRQTSCNNRDLRHCTKTLWHIEDRPQTLFSQLKTTLLCWIKPHTLQAQGMFCMSHASFCD